MKTATEQAWEIVSGREQRPNTVEGVPVTYSDGLDEITAIKLCILDLRERLERRG